MLRFFSNKNPNQLGASRRQLIYQEKDEQGIISIFFNESFANRVRGEYQYDVKGSWEKIGKPQDAEEKFKKYTVFEWVRDDKDYIEGDDTLLVIRRDENDFVKEVQNEVLLLSPILAPESGVIEIIKQEKEEICNNYLICKIHTQDIFSDSNSPQGEIYYGKFDKYEIPKHIRDRNEITGKFIFLTEWLVNSGDRVVKGQDIAKVRGGGSDKLYYTYQIKAKASGIIDLLKSEATLFVSDDVEQKEVIYIIYKDENIRFNHLYYNKSQIIIDDFTNNKILKWEIVGGYKFPYGATEENPIGGIISNSEIGKDLIFSYQNHQRRDYIVLMYFINDYKLAKGDKVYFQFENADVVDFEVIEKPYKSSYNWKRLYETKILITEKELLKFKEAKLTKWKIELESQNEQIVGLTGNDWYSGENYQTVVQNLATEYLELVNSEIENHIPLTEESEAKAPHGPDEFKCFVYLMVDITNGFHKIGISNSPEYRERTLQGEKPTIELLCAKEYPSRKIAESIEKALHLAYAEKRIRGEWFELQEEDVEELKITLK
ncbi:MAG: GIY-YIG nuclease family protein [Bacteroidetes bacterium]|nr:GIY-YIG nuclease family protein [Bacteroidota bacterium]